MLLIPALGDKFEASLVYKASSRIARNIKQRSPVWVRGKAALICVAVPV